MAADFERIMMDRWLERIRARMLETGTTCVEYVAGVDVRDEELPWIEKKLVPFLATHGMSARVVIWKDPKRDKISSCDCYSSTCYHCDGRKLRITLSVSDK